MSSVAARQSEAYASVPARVLAYLVDALLLTVILYIVAMVLGALLGTMVRFAPPRSAVGTMNIDRVRLIFTAFTNVALSAAYFVGSWIATSATPGQRLLRIRVVRGTEHSRLAFGRAAARWLLLMGPLSLGALAATLAPVLGTSVSLGTLAGYLVLLRSTVRSPIRQGLHDRYAGSIVITDARRARPASDPTRRGPRA